MLHQVFVTGATGFTGTQTVLRLLKRLPQVTCLARPGSDRSVLRDVGIRWVVGNLNDRDTLTSAFEGHDMLINVASLGFGNAENIISAAERAGVQRAIFISTTAIFTHLNVSSKAVRVDAEERIRASKLQWTILRPTMIYGSPRDRNMCRLVRYIQRYPIIPTFGSGNYLQQPVFVDDVAAAIEGCLFNERTVKQSYNIPGAEPLTYAHIIDTIADMMQRHIVKVSIPSGPIIAILKAAERLAMVRLPIKSEQIARLNEQKSFHYTPAARDFDYAPLSFAEGIRQELISMGIDPTLSSSQ